MEPGNKLPLIPENPEEIRNLFLVLPEDIWPIIVDQIENACTLQNILTALPELLPTVRKQVTTLKFLQVKPGVLEFKSATEPSIASQWVTKDWCIMVFKFLQKHYIETVSGSKNDQNPEQTEETPWNLTCYQRTKNVDSGVSIDISSLLECTEFPKFPTYRRQMEMASTIKITDIAAMQHLDATVALLASFGKGLKNVTLLFDTIQIPNTIENATEAYQKIFKCLEYLPNVRVLSFGINTRGGHHLEKLIRNHVNSESSQYPVLLQLEKLEIRATTEMQNLLLNYFLKGGYFSQEKVQSVGILGDQPVRFTCIVEYELGKGLRPKTLKEFRKFLESKKRKSITVEQTQSMFQTQLPELFQWIKDEKHEVEDLIFERKALFLPLISQEIPVLPSVKYVKIKDTLTKKYRFLTELPSLEYLHIQCIPGALLRHFLEHDDKNLTNLLRIYLYTDNIPSKYNIWNMLPSLKSLIVEEEGVFSKHFIRENENIPVIFRHIELVNLE